MIEEIKKQLLTEETLPNLEILLDFYEEYSYIIDPVKAYGFGKFLIDIGSLLQEQARTKTEKIISKNEEPTFQHGVFTITKRITPQYLYPETPKIIDINNQIEDLKTKTKTLSESIKTIHKHMQVNGEAIELEPKVAITIKY